MKIRRVRVEWIPEFDLFNAFVYIDGHVKFRNFLSRLDFLYTTQDRQNYHLLHVYNGEMGM